MSKLSKTAKKLLAAGISLTAVFGGVTGCEMPEREEPKITETNAGDKGCYVLVEINGSTWLIDASKHWIDADSGKCYIITLDEKEMHLSNYIILKEKPAEFFYDFEYGVDGTFTKPPVEQEMGD